MAQIIWTEPALSDLDEIAEYIALDKPNAANRLVEKFSLAQIVLSSFQSLDVNHQSLKHQDI